MTVVLPIGISFYTFHSLTYIIDLYRGHATPAQSFTDFSAFVALFPDLVAGPIIRYKTLAAQLASRDHTLARFASGIAIFVLGFAKKILLANPAGQRGRCGVQCRSARRVRRLVRRAGLRVPDLLRFLRLLGHGGGTGANARLRVPEELRRAVSFARASPSSGSAGTFRCRACCAITCTSRWAAIAGASGAPTSIWRS